jgi:hypothetical protein
VEAKRNTPSMISFLLVTVLIVVVIYYLVVAMNTKDLLWFRSAFNGSPESITVHCFGQDIVLTPTDPHYTAINQFINEAMSGDKRWDSTSLSVATYEDYQSHPSMMVLEAKYAPPVRVHSNVKFFSRVDTLVIPLVGRHAQYNTVFGRLQNESNAGSFHLESTAMLTEYLASQRLCVEP